MPYVITSVFRQKYSFESNLIDTIAYYKRYGDSIKKSLKLNAEEFYLPNRGRSFENEFYMRNMDVSDPQIGELKRITR